MNIPGRIPCMALIVGLVAAASSFAQPAQTRTIDIYTAPLGPSIEGIINDLKPMFQESGRKITRIQELSRNGFGKILGMRLTHEAKTPVPAQWEYQDVYVNAFGNAFNQAWEVIRFQKLADRRLLDVEIIQTLNIGKVTGLRLYFGE